MKYRDGKVSTAALALIETLAVNLLIRVVFYYLQPNQDLFLVLNPHPLLVFSIIMGMRYGFIVGTISACISSLFYADVHFEVYGNLDAFFTQFRYFKQPLLFIWSGFVLGVFKDNYRRKIKQSQESIELLTKEYHDLERDYDSVKAIQRDLKNQIIQADESIISLYNIAKSLESFEVEELYTETIGILKKYLKATDLSLYTIDDKNDFLRLRISYGDSDPLPSVKASTCSWLSFVEDERKALKIPAYTTDDTQPLMAAPLIIQDQIIAIVIINSMEFDVVSEYAFALFQLIIDWINRTIEKATFVESLMENKYIENTHIIKSGRYFRDLILIEKRRRIEFDMEYCILSYRVRTSTLEQIDTFSRKILRSVDKVYYNRNKEAITFLLPATKRANAYIIENKISLYFEGALEKIELKPLDDGE